MKKTILAILFLVSTSLIYGCSSENNAEGEDSSKGKEVTILANSVWPEDNYISKGMNEFSDKVNEATDGRVSIDVKTGGSLGYEEGELLKAVQDDLVPMTDFVANTEAGEEPLFDLTSLPMLVRDFEEDKLLNEIARPYYDDVAEEKWNQK